MGRAFRSSGRPALLLEVVFRKLDKPFVIPSFLPKVCSLQQQQAT